MCVRKTRGPLLLHPAGGYVVLSSCMTETILSGLQSSVESGGILGTGVLISYVNRLMTSAGGCCHFLLLKQRGHSQSHNYLIWAGGLHLRY